MSVLDPHSGNSQGVLIHVLAMSPEKLDIKSAKHGEQKLERNLLYL